MSGRIKVRLYATAEIRVPLVTEIDLDEYRDWVEEGGNGLYEIESDDVVEFIKSSPESEHETHAQFPRADPVWHELVSFEIDEAEVLEVTER